MQTDHIKKRLTKKFPSENSITFLFFRLGSCRKAQKRCCFKFLADFTRHRVLYGKSFQQTDLSYDWKLQKFLLGPGDHLV
jgi:hypothetical protein